MRLASFIRANLEIILKEWEEFARTLAPLHEASKVQKRDHAKAMLLVICDDLDTAQGHQDSIDKSRGYAPLEVLDTAAEAHAIDRLGSGFSVEELIAEYRALRASVLRLWQEDDKQADKFERRDMTRFNEAIDQSITESLARYSELHRDSQKVFLAILGHDVRNPLGAIDMASQLILATSETDPKMTRLAEQMRRSVKRVNEIVSDLVDFSTTHLGRGIPIIPAPMDFQVESTMIVEELRVFYPNSDIRLAFIGNSEANWDAARIGQALSNLVGNAIHHGAANAPIWITVTGSKDHIKWAIQNEGDVIKANELRFMFDPGKRFAMKIAEDGKNLPDGHLGLGLYVTRAIVAAHGGTIEVSSTELEGTTFTIRLPRAA